MDNVTALDKLVRSLSFEVQAVPQDNIIQVTTTSKSAPLNVKIRVRKKEEAGLHHGVITLPPSTSHPHSSPEIIRLVSSDQTIMSFNMIMEADFGKPKKKTRKNFLGIFKPACFGSKTDEDDNEGEINEESITQSDGALKRTTLKKNRDERTRDFFGKCRPGGCLDPPFGEDREPYSPANEEEHAVDDKVMMNAPMQSAENKSRSSSIFSNKIKSWKRKKSNYEALDKNDGLKRKKDSKTESVIDLYQSGSLRTSTTYSNSVMTYPHTVNSSELRIQENKLRLSDIYIDPSKNSFNEHSGPFFVPGIVPGAPKKIRTEEQSNAEKNAGRDGKPIEDYQRPQGLGNGGTEKQLQSKYSGAEIREPSIDPRTVISRKTDSDSAPKTDIENRTIIPVIIPLQKLGANEPPFTSSIKAEGETKDTDVLVTCSDNSLDPGYEQMKMCAEQKGDESYVERLPLDAQQNTNDNVPAKIVLINKNQFPEDVGAEKGTERQINKIDQAPHQSKDFENDLNFIDGSATVKSPKKVESPFMTEIENMVQTYVVGPEDQSTKISIDKDFTEQISVDKSEFGIDNNTENNQVTKPEVNKKLEELLALDNETSKRDDISIPATPINEFGFKSLSEDAEKSPKVIKDKKPVDKSIDTLDDRQLSAYDLTDPAKYNTTTENDDRDILTPITRDTPLELEVDDLQQIWKNDADSLESVPVTLHINKNMYEENIDILDKVNETNDDDNNNENISFFGIDNKDNIEQIWKNDADSLESVPVTLHINKNMYEENIDILDKVNETNDDHNNNENISFSGINNKDNIERYDSNGIEDASYPRKETGILEKTQSVGQTVGEDMIEVPVHEKDIDEGVQKYDENLEKPSDQVKDPSKPDEKHIKFIDVIDTEKNYEDMVVLPTESDNLKNSQGNFLENDSDVVVKSKESYPESDSYLSPTDRDQKVDIKTTAEGDKLDVAIAGFETKYPHRSISGAQSPETDFPKSFKIDLGIQSYNDNDKIIVKSFDSNTEPQRYPNDTVKVVKCDLEIGNEILVPISSENDLVVEIKSNKLKTNVIGAVGRLNTGTTEKASLGTEFQISPINRNLVIADDIRKTLLTVYEEELLPLRKSISELKSNMEVFASQQVVVKGRNMFEKRSGPSKIVPPLFKKCACIRR